MMGFMSTSLKVVSITVSLFTATKRSATLRRSIDILCGVLLRVPPHPEVEVESNPAAIASTTSCLVMRPSFPVLELGLEENYFLLLFLELLEIAVLLH